MAKAPLELKNRVARMEGTYSSTPVMLKNAKITEGFSKLTETQVEFFSTKKNLDLQDFLGSTITLVQMLENGERFFTGTCVSVEYLGLYQDSDHYVAELRPWLWFLTRKQDSRIFQAKTVVEIITEILSDDYGFSADLTKNLSQTYKAREYCVQYRETDYDFICRLMEEEGIYFYFVQEEKTLKMVLADSISAHKPTPDGPLLDFHFPEHNDYRKKDDHIFDWTEGTRARSGKLTLLDYNFEKSTGELKSVKNIAKGSYDKKDREIYDYPGHLRTKGTEDSFARVRMEAEAVQHLLSRGECNIRSVGVGQTFKMQDHPRVKKSEEHLIVRATHYLQVDNDYVNQQTNKPILSSALDEEESDDTYRCVFEVIPKSEPFRAPLITPWPGIPGMQTAVVTGPSGDEIYTDKYGRIKVQFFWDRKGKKDEKTTCWVRCVMPWTGKNWGMISVPRIGQEVAIQFEEGDPDKPICTGMLYNDQTMPPYALPANMTQTGIVTRSTKGGGTDTFNELIFEDKISAEFVRLQSERDYKETIKNNAEITIGLEHQDDGDLTQTIHRHKTETLKTGDHTFTVETGNQSVFIKTNHTEKIEGTADQTITGDTSQTILKGGLTRTVKAGDEAHVVATGSYSQTIETGDVTREVSSGNEDHCVASGDYTIDVTGGTLAITAGTEISLTVGGNSIVIDMSGITISGTMITVTGDATVDVGSPMTTVSADGVLTLEGATTMIN
ncbi:MAG: type VI secretion system tip protein TssI/VgrG [Aliishimia sp.]